MLKQIETRLGRYMAFRQVLQFSKYILIPLIVVRLVLIAFQWGLWSKYLGPSFKYENYLLSQQLNQAFTESVTFAVGDRGGSLGYFFDGKMLQLEGLVGDYNLLEAIESNTLMSYMSEIGVQYVVSYISPPQTDYDTWTMLIPFPEFSSGPYAQIEVCKRSEYLRFEAPNTTFYIWNWPSCP